MDIETVSSIKGLSPYIVTGPNIFMKFIDKNTGEEIKGINAKMFIALERISTESQGLFLRFRHMSEGEISPPKVEDIAKKAIEDIEIVP